MGLMWSAGFIAGRIIGRRREDLWRVEAGRLALALWDALPAQCDGSGGGE